MSRPPLHDRPFLSIGIRNAALRNALGRTLGDRFSLLRCGGTEGDPEIPAVIVASPPDLLPVECRRIVDSGGIVVILAALPTEFESAAYRGSGASRYLPMGLATSDLESEILGAIADREGRESLEVRGR